MGAATHASSPARPRARALLRLLLVVVVAALALAGWVWQRSEAHLASFPPPPAFAAAIPTDATSLAHGAHLAVTRGCTGCHGKNLQGKVFHQDLASGRSVAANLTRLVHDHSPAVFERAVRHGIGHDGRALYSMPSFTFTRMTDADIAALYAYIRSVPVGDPPLPAAWLSPLVRWRLATGSDAAVPAFLTQVAPLRRQSDPDPAIARGEYLAMTGCTECHGFNLRGDNPFDPPGTGPPDLAMVAAYDKADFARLMRTGLPPGDRDLGLMAGVAKRRFSHWTDTEVADLYAYLSSLGPS